MDDLLFLRHIAFDGDDLAQAGQLGHCLVERAVGKIGDRHAHAGFEQLARSLLAHAGVAAADEGDPLFDSEIHVELLVVEYVMAQCWRSYR